MAKSLRSKLANMALCCTVVTGTVGQATPVFAQSETSMEVKSEVYTSKTSDSGINGEIVNTHQTEDQVEGTKDAWETEKEDATQFGAIKVLKSDSDSPSMAAMFFEQTDLPMEMIDGKLSLKLKVSKDGMGQKDAIVGLSEKVEDKYEPLNLKYKEDANIRYIVTDIKFEDIKAPVTLQCQINAGFMVMTQELRIFLTDETIEKLEDQEKQSIEMNVQATNETVYEANDGTITVSAIGGSGNFEYTIDNGQNWSSENVFNNLRPGTYQVAVRDVNDTENVTKAEEVIIVAAKKQVVTPMPSGEYKVNIKVLHETEDKDSHAGSYFTKENVDLVIKDSKAYLKLRIARDAGEMKDIIAGLEVKENESFNPLTLNYVESENKRYVEAEITLTSLTDTKYVRCYISTPFHKADYVLRVKLAEESIKEILEEKSPEVIVVPVTAKAEKIDNQGIAIKATGGSGKFEYTIDGGVTWKTENEFKNLGAGTYKVGARDAENVTNVTTFEEIVIQAPASSTDTEETGIKDGSYSVNISVLKENSDEPSMAASYFTKTGLPLRIQNGKAYLTVQVKKDGMGMTDVITFLKQRINGKYQSLDLRYKDDKSKAYVVAEIEFESLDDVAYIQCGISAISGYAPVLRIKLDKNSLQEGAGSIDTSIVSPTTISKVEAENGKVKIKLSASDSSLTADSFTGKLYLNNDEKGTELKMKDFKVENDVVTFTYDEIKAIEKDQELVIGIILNDAETKSEPFIVKGLLSEATVQTKLSLKENAKEIKYIKGYAPDLFKPNEKVTKAETLSMLSLLVNGVENKYYTAHISIRHAEKDEPSMAGQFFKTEGIKVKKQAGRYFVELEIANEGLGFTDIITGISQKIGDTYKSVEVRKTQDMKKAYVTLEVANLDEAIALKTGIAPMGAVAPELRIVIDQKSLQESGFESGFTDIDMWAKDAIMLFEEAGVIEASENGMFNPNQNITRAEFTKIVAQVAGLDMSKEYTYAFKDLKGHVYEKYILAAAEAGYVQGYGNDTFKPEETITRAEAVKIINKLIGKTPETSEVAENPFKDLTSNHWAYDEILSAVER